MIHTKSIHNENYPEQEPLVKKKRYIIATALALGGSVGLVWRAKYKKASK